MLIWSWEIPPALNWLIELYQEARSRKEYARADAIREALHSIGIELVTRRGVVDWEWSVATSIIPRRAA